MPYEQRIYGLKEQPLRDWINQSKIQNNALKEKIIKALLEIKGDSDALPSKIEEIPAKIKLIQTGCCGPLFHRPAFSDDDAEAALHFITELAKKMRTISYHNFVEVKSTEMVFSGGDFGPRRED